MPVGTKTQQLLAQAKAAGKPLSRTRKNSEGWWVKTPDSQRSKLYKAEQVIRTGPQLTTRQVEALVLKIRTSAYVLKNYGDPGVVRVKVSNKRKVTSACDWFGGTIILAAGWGRSADVVVHEMAHMYASPAGDPGHDWLFCYIYLDLVRKFIGAGEAEKLKASFKAHKIRFTPPRKRKTMSAAQKAAAADRMAKARAARQASSVEPHVFAWLDTSFRGHERWVLVRHVPTRSGSLKLTYNLNNALVRTTDKGIVDMMKRLQMWKGSRHHHEILAIPASKVQTGQFGSVDRAWEPV